MLTLRVKQIADDELEIRILPASPQTGEPLVKILPTHERVSQMRAAADALNTFLKNGKRSARDCWEFLKGAGFETDEMNPTRLRQIAGVDTAQKERRSWWFLIAPIHAAADVLKTFLRDGERPATECEKHLRAVVPNIDDMNLWLVRRNAGVVAAQKDGQSFWFVSDQSVDIAESFHFEDDPRLELIDEDFCGHIG